MENNNVAIQETDELSGRCLLFNIGDSTYGAVLSLVIEIINIQTITKLPRVAHYIKGIINLRGKVVPILDVRLKLNMEERPYDDKTCIIVLDIEGVQVGLIVDNVLEVITLDKNSSTRPPKANLMHMQFLSSVTEIGGRVVLNIDFEKFFQDDLDMLNE